MRVLQHERQTSSVTVSVTRCFSQAAGYRTHQWAHCINKTTTSVSRGIRKRIEAYVLWHAPYIRTTASTLEPKPQIKPLDTLAFSIAQPQNRYTWTRKMLREYILPHTIYPLHLLKWGHTHQFYPRILLKEQFFTSEIISWDEKALTRDDLYFDKPILKSMWISTRHILSSKTDKKIYIYIHFFSFEKGFCILDYHIDNRSKESRPKEFSRIY